MSENGLVERIRKLLRGKRKEDLEKETESRKEDFPIIEPFSIHDWDKDFKIIALEQQAKQLAREYQALKAIHDYSEKLHSLGKHMEKESEVEVQNQDESNNENFGFEVEANEEATENVEMFSDSSEINGGSLNMEENTNLEVDTNSLDSNVELSANDMTADLDIGIGSEVSAEAGSTDVGSDFGGATGFSGSQGTGSGPNCGNIGSGSGGSGGSGSGGS